MKTKKKDSRVMRIKKKIKHVCADDLSAQRCILSGANLFGGQIVPALVMLVLSVPIYLFIFGACYRICRPIIVRELNIRKKNRLSPAYNVR